MSYRSDWRKEICLFQKTTQSPPEGSNGPQLYHLPFSLKEKSTKRRLVQIHYMIAVCSNGSSRFKPSVLTTHTFQEETTDRSHKENFNQNFSSVFSFAWKQTISSVLIHTNLLSCGHELENSSSAKTKKRINLKPSVWNLCTLELKFFQFSKILTSPNEVLLSPEIKMLSCCQNEL